MNRRSFLTQCALGSAGMAAFIQGCQPAGSTGNVSVADVAETPDSATRKFADPAPPAIDQAPPERFETATFALG